MQGENSSDSLNYKSIALSNIHFTCNEFSFSLEKPMIAFLFLFIYFSYLLELELELD